MKFRLLVILIFSITLGYAQDSTSFVETQIQRGNEQLNFDPSFAQIYFQEALKSEPNNVKALLGKGKALSYQGFATLAAEEFNKILEIDANNVEALIELSEAYRRQYIADPIGLSNRLSEALSLLQRAASIEPNNPKIFNGLGIISFSNGDLNGARSQLEQAVSLAAVESSGIVSTNLAQMHVNLGIVYRDLGENQLALQSFRRAVMTNPLSAKARNYVGFTYSQLNNCDQAVYELRQAVKINPSYLEAASNLAISTFECGNVSESVKYFENAIALPGAINIAPLYTYLARAYSEQGRYDEALKLAQQGVLLPPARADAFYYLGQVYEKRDDVTNAKKAYTRALELEPSNQLALTALSRIQ